MHTFRHGRSLNLFSLHCKKKVRDISTSLDIYFYQFCVPTGSIESGWTGKRDSWKDRAKRDSFYQQNSLFLLSLCTEDTDPLLK